MSGRLPMKTRRVNGAWVCHDCAAVLPTQRSLHGSKIRPRVRCDKCSREHEAVRKSLWMPAQYALHRAINRGELQPARSYFCVDCGDPANGYDHRDYSKPLDVDPVCRACNHKRGPAVDLLKACMERARSAA